MPDTPRQARKIIHIDMDCFYAAIEIRDFPELEGKPVAVGGRSSRRGVLTTCNYEAREYGCRSAMPTYKALQLCPKLIVRPVRFDAYREESKRIRAIFSRFTELIEPLSLDEAYLDVSHWRSSGSALAHEIRREIRETTGLAASAGIAPNKLLAKIASDWNKPDGQFEVPGDEIDQFMQDLPVRRLWGVGRKTAERLAKLDIETCGQLQERTMTELNQRFGKFGVELFHLSRGCDERPVQSSRERKSVSNERTFPENLKDVAEGVLRLQDIWEELCQDVVEHHGNRRIKSAFIKLKFSDFRQTTVEKQATQPDWDLYEALIVEGWRRALEREVRLIGAGVRFHSEAAEEDAGQLQLFEGVLDPASNEAAR